MRDAKFQRTKASAFIPRVINFVVNKYFDIFGRSVAWKHERSLESLENAVKFYREFVYYGEKTRSEEVEEHCEFAPGHHSRKCKILITFFLSRSLTFLRI